MKHITISAPGKLYLLGEHGVVYGKPALLATVNKRCTVNITPRQDKKIEIISQDLKQSVVCSYKDIVETTDQAQRQWDMYRKTKDIKLLQAITKEPLAYAMICVGEALMACDTKNTSGMTIEIRSEIPVGSGMGSSAALAVAIAGAVCVCFKKTLDTTLINTCAFRAEQKMHGTPSGGDNTASCYGGLLWYSKESEEVKNIQHLSFGVPREFAQYMYAIDTGQPEESTGEMVDAVRHLYTKNHTLVDSILTSQEALTRGLFHAIQIVDEKAFVQSIQKGEENLEKLGVVSLFTKEIIREIERQGGAAKVCGAGGTKNRSGIVLAYCKDEQVIADICLSKNIVYYPITLSDEGVREA